MCKPMSNSIFRARRALSPHLCLLQHRIINGINLSLPLILQYGSVPLGISSAKGYYKVVQTLLEGGATINHQNKVIITITYLFVIVQSCLMTQCMVHILYM